MQNYSNESQEFKVKNSFSLKNFRDAEIIVMEEKIKLWNEENEVQRLIDYLKQKLFKIKQFQEKVLSVDYRYFLILIFSINEKALKHPLKLTQILSKTF